MGDYLYQGLDGKPTDDARPIIADLRTRLAAVETERDAWADKYEKVALRGDRLHEQRNEARTERDAAREVAERERDAAVRVHAHVTAERDAAIRERDAANRKLASSKPWAEAARLRELTKRAVALVNAGTPGGLWVEWRKDARAALTGTPKGAGDG